MPRNDLCDGCVVGWVRWLGGAAFARGDYWARRVARAAPERWEQPWPAYVCRAAELARRQVRDLAGDPRLLERLGRVCCDAAARWWATSCCPAAASGVARHSASCRRVWNGGGRASGGERFVS